MNAWEVARKLFRPAGKALPNAPAANRCWFGKLGDGAGDEAILAATGDATIEVHCHGGRRVVRWVVEQFVALGCVEADPAQAPGYLISHAPTLRTASILLDQLHGAFDRTSTGILASPDLAGLGELATFAPIGRHLVEPWKVVIAGAPNVGKSSLVNALAGYQRAVVSEVAGTTRDALSVQLTFDGWPVELTDTAGLRDAVGLEAEGIERAHRVMADADLVVWLHDATAPAADTPGSPGLVVWNKCDLATPAGAGLAISAKTGENISTLVAEIVARIVPHPPAPGAAVPYSSRLADAVESAYAALVAGKAQEAASILRDCRSSP